MAAAHAVEELVVVKPRRRRAQAAAEVLLRHAVFVTHKTQEFQLGFGEIFPMHRQVVAAHRLQEHHLQVQIVVGYHFGEHGIVVAEIQQLLLPLLKGGSGIHINIAAPQSLQSHVFAGHIRVPFYYKIKQNNSFSIVGNKLPRCLVSFKG